MISKHQVYMNSAKEFAKLSKCIRLQVGCVVVNEHGRVITSGVNGSGKGMTNCCDVNHGHYNEWHHEWSLKHELHAEKNALFNLLSTGARYRELSFYVTHSPCQSCITDIVVMAQNMEIHIPRIVYDIRYDRLTDSQLYEQLLFCRQQGVKLTSLENLLNSGD